MKAGSAQIVKVMRTHFAKDCVVKVDGKDVTLESASSTELQFNGTQLAAKKQQVVVYNVWRAIECYGA